MGGYPPVYYAVMGLFVSGNILASVLLDEPGGYRWLNGRGLHSRDVPDAGDKFYVVSKIEFI